MSRRKQASKPDRPPGAPEHWLLGGGEMAKVVRSKDWSGTALGPIEAWPQSLRTIVNLAQASNFPIALAWGAGNTQIYNDGYWPICGAKHPSSMGQDFRECWASAWPQIGEAYASAWSGRSAYLESVRTFIDRFGFLEETWVTFSFSPVTDESGSVGGVFHPVFEMTRQMLSKRRIRTLRDLAVGGGKARTSEEAIALTMQVLREAELDLPFALLYLVDGDVARLVGQAGVAADVFPTTIEIGANGDPTLPIAEVARTGEARQLAVGARFAGLQVGPYPELPSIAFVHPRTANNSTSSPSPATAVPTGRRGPSAPASICSSPSPSTSSSCRGW